MQGGIPVTGDIELVFGTPVVMTAMPDAARVNEALLARIEAARAADPRRGPAAGGWRSGPDLWEGDDPGAAALRAAMHGAVAEVAALRSAEAEPGTDTRYRMRVRANVNGPGDYTARHSQAAYDWTLIYFIACGTPAADRPLSGRLELHEPRRLAEAAPLPGFCFGGSIVVDPAPGRLVLFPAWLEYSFHPWQGSGEHVTAIGLAKTGDLPPAASAPPGKEGAPWTR